MSAIKRTLSGSLASWCNMGISMVMQVISVPIFLTHWDRQSYGVWIAVQAFTGLVTIIDLGHQQFLQNEFLRIGPSERQAVRQTFWSAVPVALAIGLIQCMVVAGLYFAGYLDVFLGTDSATGRAGALIVLAYLGMWIIFGSVGGIVVRVLAPFGYYPKIAWLNVLTGFVTSLFPVMAVLFGCSLLKTGLVWVGSVVLVNVPLNVVFYFIFVKERLLPLTPDLRLGVKNLGLSQLLTLKMLLDTARNQGSRLLLAPLAGSAGLAAFATMRTGANVALQGLGTITNPLMPELMRFLNQRDQPRCEAAFGAVWVVIVALMAPAVVLVQALVEPLFLLWTRGKIPYDPWLFGVLSLSVLVYGVAQPAMAVVTGNNLLKPQLVLAALAGVVAVLGMFLLVPRIDILGAGLALLAAELVATTGYRIVARRWLRENGLAWPERSSTIAITSVWIAAVAMGAMAWFPAAKWVILTVALPLLGLNLWFFWHAMPAIATQRVKSLLLTLPGAMYFVRG